jgi:hypothetical protein
MSISGISSNCGTEQATSDNFSQLVKALQSHSKARKPVDLSSIKDFVAKLKAAGEMPSSEAPSSTDSSLSSRSTDRFQTLKPVC